MHGDNIPTMMSLPTGLKTSGANSKGVIGATYYRVTRKHLQSYVDECVFRYNVKGISVIEKMNMAIVNCRSRLTYKDLISSTKIYHG